MPWASRDKQLQCPGCGQKGEYKEYVYADTLQPVDPVEHLCGKCNHEWCYHLPPREWFSKHPDAIKREVEKIERKPMKPIVLPYDMVMKAMARGWKDCNFVRWFGTLPWPKAITREDIKAILIAYHVSKTRDGRVIWWQVDEQKRVMAGKVMRYKDDGHRVKESGNGNTDWVHAMIRRKAYGGMCHTNCKDCHNKAICPIPADEYELHQCLFGQHLVNEAKNLKVIHVVESEKTALLMAMFDDKFGDEHLWMACGGLSNLNPAILQPLKKYHIILYPDTNGIEKWNEKAKHIDNCSMSKWYKAIQPGTLPEGADIADLYLWRMLKERADDMPCVETHGTGAEKTTGTVAGKSTGMMEDETTGMMAGKTTGTGEILTDVFTRKYPYLKQIINDLKLTER